MKKILLIILCIFIFKTGAATAEKSKEDILREAVALSREVKEFGKTIGIEPSDILTKSTLESKPQSWIALYMQKRGTLAVDGWFDANIMLISSILLKNMRLEKLYYDGNFSVYLRRGEELSDNHSVITPDFARESTSRKVEVIFHEDLHVLLNLGNNEEAMVTPLAYLAAQEFFLARGDLQNYENNLSNIQYLRRVSKELLSFVNEVFNIFETVSAENQHDKIMEILESYPVYKNKFKQYEADLQDTKQILEAKISHDLIYYKCFDRIIALSLAGRAPDLKTLIEDFKKAPAENPAFETYLAELEKKYKSR